MKKFKPVKIKDPVISKDAKKLIKVLVSGKEVPYTYNNETGMITLKKPL